jgi:hypothetical protein
MSLEDFIGCLAAIMGLNSATSGQYTRKRPRAGRLAKFATRTANCELRTRTPYCYGMQIPTARIYVQHVLDVYL